MKVVAELGINHNGDMKLAEEMMATAKIAGCDYVKFQKRTVDQVYSQEYLDGPRESPWGSTQRAQKNALEFGVIDYQAIDKVCQDDGQEWFASVWDRQAVHFLSQFNMPFIKIPSALITDQELLECVKAEDIPVIISTGMSTCYEVKRAVEFLGDQLEYILACTSTYPTRADEMNLNFLSTLKKDYPKHRIGFSNHCRSTLPCVVAASMGAEMIEYHITPDRRLYGSDQEASFEWQDMLKIKEHLAFLDVAMGTGEWTVYESEQEIKTKLRR